MTRDITRRAFVGSAAAVGGLAATGCVSPATTVADPRAAGSHPGQPHDLVADASAPMSSPGRALAAFRAEVRARRAAGCDIVLSPVAAGETLEGTLRNLVALQSHLSALPGDALLVRSVEDLTRVRPRIGVIGSLHGLQMIGENIALIRHLRAAGVSVMQLTGYWKNWNGDGCLEPGDNPLTGLGRMVIQEMTRAGVVLDLAQAGRRTSLEALELTTGPVIVSRANAARVQEHPQNLTDAQIDAVRARSGVIGVSAYPPLLSASSRPTVEDLLRHLHYIVERAGIEHVALGLDFDDRPRRRFAEDRLPDPPYAYPVGIDSIADLPAFRERLSASGFSADDIAKVLGGNLLRVLEPALAAVAPA